MREPRAAPDSTIRCALLQGHVVEPTTKINAEHAGKDADYLRTSRKQPVAHAEAAGHSIAITPHRFPAALRDRERYGLFNVGWLTFRRTDTGLACVSWWRARCIERCYDRVEDGKYADQKYLDQWPAMFGDLCILQHKGVSVAPWNLESCQFSLDRASALIDGEPLICFHFHGLKHVLGPLYESGLRPYRAELTLDLRRAVFDPYLAELIRLEAELARAGMTAGHAKSLRGKRAGLRGLIQRAAVLVTAARLLASGKALIGSRRAACSAIR